MHEHTFQPGVRMMQKRVPRKQGGFSEDESDAVAQIATVGRCACGEIRTETREIPWDEWVAEQDAPLPTAARRRMRP